MALIGEAAAALKLLQERCGDELAVHLCGAVLPESGLPGELQAQLVGHVRESVGRALNEFLRGLLLSARVRPPRRLAPPPPLLVLAPPLVDAPPHLLPPPRWRCRSRTADASGVGGTSWAAAAPSRRRLRLRLRRGWRLHLWLLAMWLLV